MTDSPPVNSQSGGRKRGRPSTAEMDYSDDEDEFLRAIEAWKNRNRRRQPTNTELLAIARELGYRKVAHEDTTK